MTRAKGDTQEEYLAKRRVIVARWDKSPRGRLLRRDGERSDTRKAKNAAKKRQQRLDSETRARDKARLAIRDVIRRGDLVRPTTCPKCCQEPDRGADGRSRIQFHHNEGYSTEKHLVGEFLCEPCHHKEG